MKNKRSSNYGLEGMLFGLAIGAGFGFSDVVSMGQAVALGLILGLAFGSFIKRNDSDEDE